MKIDRVMPERELDLCEAVRGEVTSSSQARSQTMNTVGAAASNAGP